MSDDKSATGESPDTTRRALLKAAAGASATGVASSAGCIEVITPADVAAESEIQGNVGYFVGATWLADHRDEVVVLDARDRERFRKERVHSARHVPIDTVTPQEESGKGLVPAIDEIASGFGERGLSPDDDVVVYGASVGSRVTRVAFALEAAGHDGDVRVLNGGFEAWNGRLGTGSRGGPKPNTYHPEPDANLWVTREWLADTVGSFNGDGPGLVDIRVPEAYLAAAGSDALDSDHDRHGHFPGALNLHWVGNVAGRQLTAPSTLVQLYEGEAGLDLTETVVVYGDENVDPTSTWLTLRAIGFEDVRLYDGGFSEWANVEGDRGRYPVETATNVVIETEGEVGGEDSSGDFSCTG